MNTTLPPRLLTASLCLALSACSTLSEEECLNADWYLIGLEDGSRGYDVSRIGSHREACAKTRVVPEIDAYRQGLAEGHERYCLPANGYKVGLSGAEYRNVCGAAQAKEFVSSYQLGRDLYRLRETLRVLDQQIYDNRNLIEELDEDTDYHEQQLIHHASSPGERQQHLDAIKDNEREAASLAESIVYSERERAVLARDLADTQAYHRELGY